MTPLTVRDEPFDRVCTEWQGLVDQAHMPVPFVTPAWQRVWLSHFQDGRRLQIKIPAGVRDGARIKLRGAGLKEGAGALSGDLYVTVHVRPDSRFERDGANLRTEVAVTLLEAMGGAEVPIQTPTGTLKLRIRANTQNGQEIHVSQLGSVINLAVAGVKDVLLAGEKRQRSNRATPTSALNYEYECKDGKWITQANV